MDELISKKELLEKYGISYGALYRWKRMGLIPEDWFEKKSAVTGQETFFPRAAITERIEMILELKDQMSLEEIAAKVNGETPEKTRHLRIIWDGGTTQIPLSKIHSIVVTENSGSDFAVIIDLSAELSKSAEIKLDSEAIRDNIQAKLDETSKKINQTGRSLEEMARDFDEKLAKVSEVINEMFSQKGNE
ncbi:MAG: DUF4004 family protein [Clostridia bacterium]|nr:DUF4004 family protein [Clostridia bacterium]